MGDYTRMITTPKAHTVLWMLGLIVGSTACSEPEPPLVPWPSSIEFHGGEMALTPASAIVVQHSELDALASVLAEEISLAFGLDMGIRSETHPGDIVLQLDSQMLAEEYSVTSDSMVVVTGGNYIGVALGTTTLLQALAPTATGAAVPHMRIYDSPQSSYRGLLVDVARQWHSIETLKQIVVMCRLYKIRYLQLHLTDNQSFTFPSESFPSLATPGRSFSGGTTVSRGVRRNARRKPGP